MIKTPEFDASAVMNPHIRSIAVAQLYKRVASNRNASWTHSPQRDRFVLLNFLARDFQQTGDPRPYQEIAKLIAGDLCMAPAVALPAAKSNRFTQVHAREALRSIGAVLESISTPWYLVSGTFLGAVRESDFLAHDYDIDIGVNIENLNADLLRIAILADANLTLVNESPYIHQKMPMVYDIRPALFRVMHCSGVEVDIFVHHLDSGQRWHGSTMHRWTNKDFTLADYTIANMKVCGPKDADRYLTENYGNWRVPVKVFNCSTGTPNVSFNHNLFLVSRLLHAAARATLVHSDVDSETARMILIQENYLSQAKNNWDFTIPWAS